jgi:hypothetical protein
MHLLKEWHILLILFEREYIEFKLSIIDMVTNLYIFDL